MNYNGKLKHVRETFSLERKVDRKVNECVCISVGVCEIELEDRDAKVTNFASFVFRNSKMLLWNK